MRQKYIKGAVRENVCCQILYDVSLIRADANRSDSNAPSECWAEALGSEGSIPHLFFRLTSPKETTPSARICGYTMPCHGARLSGLKNRSHASFHLKARGHQQYSPESHVSILYRNPISETHVRDTSLIMLINLTRTTKFDCTK